MPQAVNAADHFTRMAGRIEGTAADEFGGAVCIVGPDGNTIEYMLTDPKQDAVFFWLGLETRIQTVRAQLEQMQRDQQAAMYGRR